MTTASEIADSSQMARALELFLKYYSGRTRQPLLAPSLTPDVLMSSDLARMMAQRVCECEDAIDAFYGNNRAFGPPAFDLISMQLIRGQRFAYQDFGRVLAREMGLEDL